MEDNNVDKQKYITIAKYGIMVVAVALLAPVAWMAVSGMMGLALAASIGLVGINAAPVLAQKLANAKYRALDADTVEHIAKVSEAACLTHLTPSNANLPLGAAESRRQQNINNKSNNPTE